MPDSDPAAAAQGDAAGQALANILPSGQQVYDAIMARIEPELTSEGLRTLDEKYASEKPEEKKQRMDRYAEAFKRYDEEYQAWIENLQDLVQEERRAALKEAEVRVQKEETEEMGKLEAMFDAQATEPPLPTAVPNTA